MTCSGCPQFESWCSEDCIWKNGECISSFKTANAWDEHEGNLDLLFLQITTFIKVHVMWSLFLESILFNFNQLVFNKIYQLKGLQPKNKDHTNIYEC